MRLNVQKNFSLKYNLVSPVLPLTILDFCGFKHFLNVWDNIITQLNKIHIGLNQLCFLSSFCFF